jgi:hypothetical protein
MTKKDCKRLALKRLGCMIIVVGKLFGSKSMTGKLWAKRTVHRSSGRKYSDGLAALKLSSSMLLSDDSSLEQGRQDVASWPFG